MGLNFSFKLSAAQTVTAAELKRFLKSVETDAKTMGFEPTDVFVAEFKTQEQIEFARSIHVLFPIRDEKLKGVTLLSPEQVLDYQPSIGRCRVLPQQAVVLLVTDERKNETVFAFARYPKTLVDLNGRVLVEIPFGGCWHFEDFIQSPDPRFRKIIKRFPTGLMFSNSRCAIESSN